MFTTRFNPTANGRIHVGHLYLVLLNYYASKNSGGKFIIRFDDDQPYWIKRIGRSCVDDYCNLIIDDLEWLGIIADKYSYESIEREENEKWLSGKLNLLDDRDKETFDVPEVKSIIRTYPFVPYLTAVKVVQDHREECNLIIRGDDLLTEYSLYCYFCKVLNFPFPKFQYVPRLLLSGGDDISDLSKTKGNMKIQDFRNLGWNPSDVISLLEKACLENSENGWTFQNVKKFPRLDENYVYNHA